MTIAEFWNAQEFSYIATYSFNRSTNLTALQEAIDSVNEALEQSILSANLTQQFKLKRQLAELERQAQISPYKKRLVNQEQVIDNTANRIALIENKSLEVKRMTSVIEAAPSEIDYAAGCIPVYRDALVFYNEQGQLLRVLNICFECLYMEADTRGIKASTAVYDALRELLIQLGHPIED
ncbi:hypothetical protein FNT36_19655 [Hymenobacter setariae]|uniref:Uncharacterized protein n=1 Tax=Hymenobacter setariae TaxID=2594794 RepID=A0A558BPI7_9BACT|nr:hypothetical protein [Hymenobacter setariae]TVT38411.1 hypothetical protein FNT36_19655 [Hymenobacter setariae]